MLKPQNISSFIEVEENNKEIKIYFTETAIKLINNCYSISRDDIAQEMTSLIIQNEVSDFLTDIKSLNDLISIARKQFACKTYFKRNYNNFLIYQTIVHMTNNSIAIEIEGKKK